LVLEPEEIPPEE
jgi:hypothetical protein